MYEGSVSQDKLEARGPAIPIGRSVRQGDPLLPEAVHNDTSTNTNISTGSLEGQELTRIDLHTSDTRTIFSYSLKQIRN
ncbi:unnamed protein product [Pieris brassicae]|uniref:Uncharacterized protein n=1 Tax=Pieris brassicae TaxID=7116 RepID=A0A9P0XIV0_PIEBR|nr:unnamed protein product [Pieris brassicae]